MIVTVILECEGCGRHYVGPSDVPASEEACAACGGALVIEDSEVNRQALRLIDGDVGDEEPDCDLGHNAAGQYHTHECVLPEEDEDPTAGFMIPQDR